jgi:hypothetical protein
VRNSGNTQRQHSSLDRSVPSYDETVSSYKSQVRGGYKLSCQRAHDLIHPYVDGELGVLQTAEVERHIDQCEDCKLDFAVK